MKTKLFVLAALPLLLLQASCESTSKNNDSQCNIHGKAGVGVQSRDTSQIAPTRSNSN